MTSGIAVNVVMTPEELIRRHEARNKRILYKQGAYARTAMQRSMRYSNDPDKHSLPGQPPLAHKKTRRGPLLRKLIRFRVDERDQSVVAGPEKAGEGDVPRTLDQGGRIQMRRLQKVDFAVGEHGPIRYLGGGKFRRARLNTPSQTARAQRLVLEENDVRQNAAVHVKPRPFTAPVLSDGGENLRKLVAREPL